MLTKILKVVILSIAVFCASAVYAGAFEDGVAAYDKKNYAVALSKFKLAAAQGLAAAQFNLGIMYSNGVLCLPLAVSRRFIRKLVLQGETL